MAKTKAEDNTVCRNRKASYRFEILEEFECGMVLLGTEVKSLRDKQVSLEEAYARISDGALWLIGCHIAPYKYGTTLEHDPIRKRKLLMHNREIRKLRPKVELKGLTLVPIRMYFNARGIAKVAIALARGKTVGDKRESIKAREHRREMDRASRGRS